MSSRESHPIIAIPSVPAPYQALRCRSAATFLAIASTSVACGGLLLPDGGTDAGPDAGSDGRPPDGGVVFPSDAEEEEASLPLCSEDASPDTGPCTPPADDTLYADPPVLSVSAGSYGAANFVAAGPWVNDPSMYVWFEGSTLTLGNYPQVTTYGSPQSILFLTLASEAGQQGTITVEGHAGNIVRTATVTVNVTTCAPWSTYAACGVNACGVGPDGCGGLESCGECPSTSPTCYNGQCVAQAPPPCPNGYGYDPSGVCVSCEDCQVNGDGPPCVSVGGTCIAWENLSCVCSPPPRGVDPAPLCSGRDCFTRLLLP